MRKPRIIIFDDDFTILSILNDFFSEMNFEVQFFNQAILCLACENTDSCINKCADIIITDFNMPGINGIELLNHQIKRGCAINIKNKAIMSGALPDKYINEMKGLADTFFQKPFRMQTLTAWTQECISRNDLLQPLGNYYV